MARTLGAVLRNPLKLALCEAGSDALSSAALADWMHDHLRLAVHPCPDVNAFLDLEDEVLSWLDPPLNIDRVERTPLRARLSDLGEELRPVRAEAAAELPEFR